MDTRTPEQRAAITAVVSPWITGCAESGYHAVEFDNLDTYTRSDGVLRRDDALALAAQFVAAAHSAGLAAAQKNSVEDAPALRAAGFDFAITEECAAYEECSAITAVYGAGVVDVEYTDNLPRPFSAMCTDPETPASVVLRDRDLVAPTTSGYHFRALPLSPQARRFGTAAEFLVGIMECPRTWSAVVLSTCCTRGLVSVLSLNSWAGCPKPLDLSAAAVPVRVDKPEFHR